MNKVFGILLAGLVLVVSTASSPSVAGNWNQTNEVTIYGGKGITNEGWAIPFTATPNYATAKVYLKRYLYNYRFYENLRINPSLNPKELVSIKSTSRAIQEEMQSSSLLSYLLYDKGKILVDEITPRFDGFVSNDTLLYSKSIGKSLTSYVLAHAICDGYIENLSQKVNDWGLLKNTLYEQQSLQDLVNMNTGDYRYVNEKDGMVETGRWFNNHSIKSLAENELKGTKPAVKKYNYNGLPPNIIFGYIMHKTGKDFYPFINKIFKNHIGIGGELLQNKNSPIDAHGPIKAVFYAKRYDFLRIAVAMLNDWKEDGCVGKYLKDVHKFRISKNASMPSGRKWQHEYWRGYGGFFHTDLLKMSDRHIMGMNGLGGQLLWIDFDKSRILYVHTVHGDYDHNKIALRVIKGEEDIYELLDIKVIDEGPAVIGQPNDRTTKYDRTVAGMKMRFKCLTDFAAANDITDLPANQEIESLIANIEGNDYYRSHRQIVKAGIPKEAMDTNKKALVRLVNYEGTNEEYCAKPIL
ncbi:hypothetical protein OAR83_02290 [Alphaproteobacteria bacterium]|nr:hypothetical protein [Alphaproteobacteria bacterium]